MKLSKKQRAAVEKAERERIGRILVEYCDSMRTARDDEYGAGWNAALASVRVVVRP